MSSSDRNDRPALIVLGLLVAAVVVMSLSGLYARHQANYQVGCYAPPGVNQSGEKQYEPICPEEHLLFGDGAAQWVMALFAALATGVSWRALVLIRRTFIETERTASAAIESNNIARDTANRQLRAYVSTAEIAISNLAVGKAFKTSVKWTNRGQTPARVLRAFASVRATTDPENEKFFFDATGGTSKGTIGASAFVVHEIGALSVVTDGMVTPIMDGSYNLAIGAYMIYEDVFGVTRRTVVRAMLDRRSIVDGTAGIHYCTRNNKAN